MPDDPVTSADVSGFPAVSEALVPHVTTRLHQSRAFELLKGSALSIAVAMSSVFVARQLAPGAVRVGERQVGKLIQRYGDESCKGAELHDAARKTVNMALMLTSGLVTGICSQTLFARKRRDAFDIEHNISVGRDVTRLLTGWSFGSLGATAAYYLAERYGRYHIPATGGANPAAYCDILGEAERGLDKVLKGATYAQENKISEGLLANAIMTTGAIPANLVGQKIYDNLLVHPAYVKER